MGSVLGTISEETPKYDLLKAAPTYEVRRYHPQIRATCTYKAEGFGGSGGLG